MIDSPLNLESSLTPREMLGCCPTHLIVYTPGDRDGRPSVQTCSLIQLPHLEHQLCWITSDGFCVVWDFDWQL